jgi:D-alanyl-D-alanine carboxypeptidase
MAVSERARQRMSGFAQLGRHDYDRAAMALARGTFALICVSLVLASASATTAEAARGEGFGTGAEAQISSLVTTTMAAGKYPGMVVGVWAPGRAFTRAYGVRVVDPSRRMPMRTTDYFRIGSITKTMTATLILRLVEQQRLSLNDPLSMFFPNVPRASQITIRQLLNHTSQIPDLAASTGEQLLRFHHKRFEPQAVIDEALEQEFCKTSWCYSNTNYLLLGLIAEAVAKRPIGELLQREVFAPAGLTHTSFDPGTRVPKPIANGYTYLGRKLVNTTRWTTSYTWAAGSVVSTLADLRQWAPELALGSLLDEELQRERLQLVSTTLGGIEYGLGIAEAEGFLGHDGLLFGYDSTELYSPSLHTTVVVLANAAPVLYEAEKPPSTLVLALQLAQGHIAGRRLRDGRRGAAVGRAALTARARARGSRA